MLQFNNKTPFKGAIAFFPDVDGTDTMFAIVKGTFAIERDGRLAIAEDQAPVALAPRYHGDPATSSLAEASDLSLMKRSTDVVIVGDASAPGGRPTASMDVGVAVGPLRQSARIIGDRFWQHDGLSYRASSPAPFVRMPLVWERAFGGKDETDKGPREEPRNPSGTGFRESGGKAPVEGMRLPNIEDPRDPVSSWSHRPTPVGFAPIPPNWEPRRSYGGTYDEAWQKNRAPYLPHDFDARFLQIAPPSMVAPEPFSGREVVELTGFHADGPVRFALPAARPTIVFKLNGKNEEGSVMIDTVILEPSARRARIVWRSALRCDKKTLKVREVEASLPRSS